ncbi:hypothetical protein A5746_12595 [Mycolicibacterium conceptionense]|uniref:hypothetical protein n=1 Tax=Mycolicibacterium conceptionense TaxID=451644 RepID=UPI0007ED5BF3|nr:hypothetical protein [Mycolicibacterium conceptionense]OBK06516.1 hypothetical protein A5639_16270 [Mycolicibacterium conceptionense]OMB79393.1 hypothetical protein A5741_01900 [Mycolicibacterium conceptionense]OMC00203.1 hypothetical protein A5746_12595 [Mycolicibacterium conceptionense]
MNTSLPAPSDPNSPNVEIVSIPDEFGSIVIGTDHELDEFVQRWEQTDGRGGSVMRLGKQDLQKAALLAPQLLDGTKVARFVLGSALWRQVNGPAPGTIVTYHRMTRNASTGRILANPRIASPSPAGAVGGPAGMATMISIQIALNQLAERIEARLDVIEDKIDQVLQLASAQRLGDVYGHLRLLQRRLREVDAGNQLTDTDWSSIASLGTDLEVGVERLRQHTIQLLSTLNSHDSADKRADNLKSIVEKGRMCETLQLLLVAQQSLYIWQRLRLERVSTAEPGFIAQTVESARTTLREQLDADRALAEQLRRIVDKYAALRVTEVHHQLAARTMTKYRVPLVEMVDKFIEIRGLQIERWLDTRHASFRDAINAATTKTAEVTRRGRKQLAKWIEPEEKSSNS